MKQVIKFTDVKQTTRNLRIWIEGKNLAAAGFHWHTPYDRKFEMGKITLTLGGTGPKETSGRTRNGKDTPIIDISLARIEGFQAGGKVQVTYNTGQIVLEAV